MTTPIRLAAITLMILGPLVRGNGTDVNLKIKLSPEKASYSPGDKLTIEITFQNTSARAIRFLPDPIVYPAKAFDIQHNSTREHGKFLYYSEIGIDVEQWARETVILKPGEINTRRVPVEIVDRLPDEYKRRDRGLFMLFPISAIELRGPGEYRIVMKYNTMGDVIGRLIHAQPKLWEGQTSSTPIVASFSER